VLVPLRSYDGLKYSYSTESFILLSNLLSRSLAAGQPWTGLEAPARNVAACVGVEYSLTGQGYHRTLLASIWREEEEEGKGEVRCEGGVRQEETFIIAVNVTSSMYIDLDQVSCIVCSGPSPS